MSKQKWQLFFAIIIFIDFIQFLLTLTGVGIAVNVGIDIVVGILLPFTLQLSGVSMASPKMIASVFGVFGLEILPLIGALPLWTLDLIIIYFFWKAEQKSATLSKITKVASLTKRAPLNQNPGIRLPTGRDTI
jgi:hypothetical protein